jgi:hypothetical protein
VFVVCGRRICGVGLGRVLRSEEGGFVWVVSDVWREIVVEFVRLCPLRASSLWY